MIFSLIISIILFVLSFFTVGLAGFIVFILAFISIGVTIGLFIGHCQILPRRTN